MATVEEGKNRMDDALEAIRREFATVRTGKATPALLDSVKVEAYGSQMPLNQVATLNTPDSSMIVVQPFDKSLLGDIEKGIMMSDLGLNPMNDGNVIRVPIPPLNEERRREFVKILHKMAEEGRISLRHARRTVRDQIHDLIKNHEIGEDEGRRREDQLEKLTNDYSNRIEALLKAKEEEVMAI
ncbi:MAG TPA: ribosome recycling factor [Gemmatimonadetes bacterium]|jgi:ribosome recycling factor|nr:ribosome recycling factor [Gemmatimonadaceae bacterium]MBR42997.1 ribosome recycling factor [Gemmatimonadota bacterium]MEE2863333.1 ribosome recycling factor [Gemmatimonadota bacterium]HAY76212.1 ribosome recycling factor [Gemmatimonadota bacterium]|tara:strand:+ start:33397 stop:33948 length:552 start_codon:yes stop_codon:yes gene_type:complete